MTAIVRPELMPDYKGSMQKVDVCRPLKTHKEWLQPHDAGSDVSMMQSSLKLSTMSSRLKLDQPMHGAHGGS